mmetsp:Transcript_13430/g.26576  ORF Transcript_13430/g.26576 Transcript_13430/m.26576 type:complete len:206 (-) Transcript_13430:1788-2405(-)
MIIRVLCQATTDRGSPDKTPRHSVQSFHLLINESTIGIFPCLPANVRSLLFPLSSPLSHLMAPQTKFLSTIFPSPFSHDNARYFLLASSMTYLFSSNFPSFPLTSVSLYTLWLSFSIIQLISPVKEFKTNDRPTRHGTPTRHPLGAPLLLFLFSRSSLRSLSSTGINQKDRIFLFLLSEYEFWLALFSSRTGQLLMHAWFFFVGW